VFYAGAKFGAACIPGILFDGDAVYAAMSVQAHARTGYGNVNDVLDTVVKIMRSNVKLSKEIKND